MKLIAVSVFAACIYGQTAPVPSREYIHLGPRVVAIENGVGSGTNRVFGMGVWPPSSSLGASQQQTFDAVVWGPANTAATWSISPPGYGQISGSGVSAVYTAPATIASNQAVTVTATSVADPTKSATAQVRFYSPSSTSGDYPLFGSFLNFYRSMPQQLWGQEFGWMRQIDMNTIVLTAVGALQPNSSDPTGYSLSAEGLLYPSSLVDASIRPTTDLLDMVLSFADANGMKVYVGSLQTWSDWTDGMEFSALGAYNLAVGREILTNYGSRHPSLGGWYFTQELWMNWIQYYGPGYYGTTLLANYISDMKSLDPTKPVSAAVVFKETGYGAMPGMSPADVQTQTTSFLQTTGLQLLMPQDGAGAEAGAPPIGDLPAYYQAFRNAVQAAETKAALWSTVETFTAVPNVSGEQYPPASAARIQQQVANERPYVSGYVNYIYGDDLSQQATYYPVEASALNRDYQTAFRPLAIPAAPALIVAQYQSSPAPSPYYPDTNRHLSDRTGGGYVDYGLTDWSGYAVEDTGGKVTITADLGSVQRISAVRALSLSETDSGIFHPSRVAIETSNDGVNFQAVGVAGLPLTDTSTFSVGWSELNVSVAARYVRYNFTHQQWLFVSELEILGNPGGTAVEIDPPSAFLYAGQSLTFTGSVLGNPGAGIAWSAFGAGSVSSSGTYTAPTTVTAPTEAFVTASSLSTSAMATVTVAPDPTGVQMVGPVLPSSGSGFSQTFQFTANPVSGTLDSVQVAFGPVLSTAYSCAIYYDVATNSVRVYNDAGTVWLGAPVVGAAGAAPVGNSQCTVNAAGGSVGTTAGGGLTLSLPISFSTAWSGVGLSVFMAAEDSGGNKVDWWPMVGTWSVP